MTPIITPEEIQQYVVQNQTGRWILDKEVPLDYSKKLPVLAEQGTGEVRCAPPVCRLTAIVGRAQTELIDICVDSGATLSMMSVETYNRIKTLECTTPLKRTEQILTGAGGASLNVVGITCVFLQVQGAVLQATMYVGDLKGVDVLLGMDWLTRVGAIIDLGRMELTVYPRFTIKLRDSHIRRPETLAINCNQSAKNYSEMENAVNGFAAVKGDQVVAARTVRRIKCQLTGKWIRHKDAYFIPISYEFGNGIDIIESLERPKQARGETIMYVAISNNSDIDIILDDELIVGQATPLQNTLDEVSSNFGNNHGRTLSSQILHADDGSAVFRPESKWTGEELLQTKAKMEKYLSEHRSSAEKPFSESDPNIDCAQCPKGSRSRLETAESQTGGSSHLATSMMSTSQDPVTKACEPGVNVLGHCSTGSSPLDSRERSSGAQGGWGNIPVHLRCMLPPRETMNEEQRDIVEKLIIEFSDIFVGPDGSLGWTDKTKHEIKLEDGTIPFKSRLRPLSVPDKEFVRKTITELLQKGKIQPSKSPWGAPPVLVRKKDGTQRFCVDFRKLNDATKKDAYPIPRIDELLDCLNGGQYFCTLDFASGYWQIAMDPRDVEKTAFITHCGLYEWIIMPFGLCNAPATFCRLMENVMSDIVWQKCLVYLDDVIAFGRTLEETIENLRAVFIRIRRNNLKLKASKCFLFRRKVEYLGHEVSGQGIRPSPQKIVTLHDIAMPTTLKEVRSFLGVCSYYRRFIPHFSEYAEPSIALTRKGVICDTNTEECRRAFEELKRKLVAAPTLHYVDPTLPFILDTDASDNAIGACLSQESTDAEGNKFELPIAFASKTLPDTRRRYCTTKKELYAVVYYLSYWSSILRGCDVTVRTDHQALLWLINFGKQDVGLQMYFRWVARLSQLGKQLRIIHRPGVEHTNADGFSRMQKLHTRKPGIKVRM